MIIIGQEKVTVEQIERIAQGEQVQLADTQSFRRRIERGSNYLDTLLTRENKIYGVTTGYGDSVTTTVPFELIDQLPMHLVRFHNCGMGAPFDKPQTRAICAARLVSLAQGFSAVRWIILERLVMMLNHNILPIIPQEGSVGASGDLTPLSYVAATLIGEGEVWLGTKKMPAFEAWQRLQLQPLQLRPKEPLALMNGTSAMTGVACLNLRRAHYLCRLASRVTALAVASLQGNPYHFDARLFAAKPHPGQNTVAGWIRTDLNPPKTTMHNPEQSVRLQDRYSLRCAPHVLGVLLDNITWVNTWLERELNSANDNPLIDPEEQRLLHGGHFYGGHVALAMDALKTSIASVADLLDRQMAHLCDPKMNQGLPANLTGCTPERRSINHGFKAIQIATSAWAAEALKLTMPATSFSRSTECHNQDKVSMGTIAARDCARILVLTEQIISACLLACTQAVHLRQHVDLSENSWRLLAQIRQFFPPLTDDRPLQTTLEECYRQIINQTFECNDAPIHASSMG